MKVFGNLVACTVAMNLASVELVATVAWSLDLYAMVPPARQNTMPVREHHVLVSVV